MLDHDVAEIKHFGQLALVIPENVCQVETLSLEFASYERRERNLVTGGSGTSSHSN